MLLYLFIIYINIIQEFTNDLPALLEKSLNFKKEILSNPEKLTNKDLILAKFIDKTDDDYLVNLSLSLLE